MKRVKSLICVPIILFVAPCIVIAEFTNPAYWTTYIPGNHIQADNPDGYAGAIFDGRYIYFVPEDDSGKHGEVLRYDTSGDFSTHESWVVFDPGKHGLGNDPDGYVGGIFDGRYVYFVPHHNGFSWHAEVLRYDTNGSFFNISSWVTFDAEANGLGSSPYGYAGGVYDKNGQYVYFVPHGDNDQVLRYDASANFSNVSSWTIFDLGDNHVVTHNGYIGAAFDGRYIYFSPHRHGGTYHSEVLRYDTEGHFGSPTSWASHTYFEARGGYTGAIFDGVYVYFVPFRDNSGHHGQVLRYDTRGNFNDNSSWATFDAGDHGLGISPDGYVDAIFDGIYIYFAPHHNYSRGYHGEVLRYDTRSNFLHISSWMTFDPGDNGVGTDPDGFHGGTFDGHYVYFAPRYNSPSSPDGEVLRYQAYLWATIDIDPDTLNLNSKDMWITCYIELPEDGDVMDIDGATVMLENISAYIGKEGWARAGANTSNIIDHDEDGILERMVKFDMSQVQNYLTGLGILGEGELMVTGELINGTPFEGTDTIRVIDNGVKQ